MTAKDNWQYKLTNLDKYQLGKKVKYIISEDKVTGYTTTVNGFNLTNSLNESPTPINNQSGHQGTPKSHKSQGLLGGILPATEMLSSKTFVISGLLFIMFILSMIRYVFSKRRQNK